jgi:hypothetical protein
MTKSDVLGDDINKMNFLTDNNNNNISRVDEMTSYLERQRRRQRSLRILICTESFHPYTSGIARRFKEVIARLAQNGHRIHILTGSKDCHTIYADKTEEFYNERVTFSQLKSIEFNDKIDCTLPFLLPQVRYFLCENKAKSF